MVKFIETESSTVVARGQGRVGGCLLGIELHLAVLQVKRVMETGCRTLSMCFTLLNCTLKIKILHFVGILPKLKKFLKCTN